MNQLLPIRAFQAGEFYAGNNTFVCRPGEGDSVYCPRHGELVPDPKKGVRWGHPVVVAAILMGIGGIIVAVFQTIGAVTVAYLTHPGVGLADKCQGALSHYQEAIKQELLRDALQDHIKRFPDCAYADQARIKIASITSAAPTPPRQVTGPLSPPLTIKPAQPVTPVLSPQQTTLKARQSIDQFILDSAIPPINRIRNIFDDEIVE